MLTSEIVDTDLLWLCGSLHPWQETDDEDQLVHDIGHGAFRIASSGRRITFVSRLMMIVISLGGTLARAAPTLPGLSVIT
ncbi:hypothetical protein ABT255_45080 [Streptomyces mirabilis]|uniref:hypothetical protein n=1 Tax=Streptomyces mirabilis TaxID=68239 RepID=UPI0033345B0C